MSLETKQRNYDPTAWFYELVAEVYSAGAIRRVKLAEGSSLPPPRSGRGRILVVGCGAGEDVLKFAEEGHDITVVDISKKMLARLKRKLDHKGLEVNIVHQDITDFVPAAKFDVVIANFFLNCFSPETMRTMLTCLVGLVAPDGKIIIGDFAPLLPDDGLLTKAVKQINFRVANIFYGLFGIMAQHRIYDYSAELKKIGWETCETHFEPMILGYLKLYSYLIAKRNTC